MYVLDSFKGVLNSLAQDMTISIAHLIPVQMLRQLITSVRKLFPASITIFGHDRPIQTMPFFMPQALLTFFASTIFLRQASVVGSNLTLRGHAHHFSK